MLYNLGTSASHAGLDHYRQLQDDFNLQTDSFPHYNQVPDQVMKKSKSGHGVESLDSLGSSPNEPQGGEKKPVGKWKRFIKTADALQKSGLMDVTMKTAELLKRNNELKKEIANLHEETVAFIVDVLNNPENREAKARFEAASPDGTVETYVRVNGVGLDNFKVTGIKCAYPGTNCEICKNV